METYGGYNVAVVLFAAFGSWMSGYGLAVIIATLGQPTFYASMGLVSDPTALGYGHTESFTATIQGVFFAGGFLGCLFTGLTGSKLGRLRGFQLASIMGVIGSGIQAGATNQGMYIAARAITGFATGQAVVAMPVYYAEVAPPHSRGLMAGAHGCFINVGYASANWIGYGTYNDHHSSFAWRFPQAVLGILSLCLLAGSFFVPESPRWLVANGNEEKALAILCRLHHDPKDVQDTFAHQELTLIHQQIAEDKAQVQQYGRWQIFTLETYRKRFVLACILIIGTQNTGVLVINSFNTLLYQSLGLTNTEALIVSAAYNTWAMIANFIGATFNDRLGRRKCLLIGFTSNMLMFVVATGLVAKYSETPTKGWAAAALTFFFLYVFFYAAFIDVNGWTVATEIFPSHLRAQGSALSISTFMLTDLLWLELAPTASATIGWKYYLIFIGLTCVHIVYFWFKLPETSGLALEEIDVLFGKEPAGRVTGAATNLQSPKDADFQDAEAISGKGIEKRA